MQLGGKAPSFNQIRYFVAVAKYLNFRQAAGALGISQPTLTSQNKCVRRHTEFNAVRTFPHWHLAFATRKGAFSQCRGGIAVYSTLL